MTRLHPVGAAFSRDKNYMPLYETRNSLLSIVERVNHVQA